MMDALVVFYRRMGLLVFIVKAVSSNLLLEVKIELNELFSFHTGIRSTIEGGRVNLH